MADLEKVLYSLSCYSNPSPGQNCIQCYYRHGDICIQDLTRDAAELLNEQEPKQEPRVLTVEEVRSKQTKAIPVWKETKSKNKALYVGWVLAYEVQTGQGITGDCLGMAEPSGRMVWYKLSDYGKTWRVWSARPTDAQREVVKWDDDTNPYI